MVLDDAHPHLAGRKGRAEPSIADEIVTGRNFRHAEVGAPENDAASGRGGQKRHLHGSAGMQGDAGDGNFAGNGMAHGDHGGTIAKDGCRDIGLFPIMPQ